MTDHTTHYDASEHHHDDCGCQSERLRKELAAAQAQIVALREALAATWPGIGDDRELGGDVSKCHALAVAALSQPTGTEALRAFGERCVAAGQKDAFDEISAMDAGVARKQQDASAIVARILGESGVANG